MDKVIVLVLTIVMPPGVPDQQRAFPMQSVEECWSKAKEFSEQGVTDVMKAHGVIGVGGGCFYLTKSEAQKEQEQQEEKHKQIEEEKEKL